LLLHKCQELISNTANPFLKKNLTTAKVFKDILEYHRSTHPRPAKLVMVTKKKAYQSNEGTSFKRNLGPEQATGDQITILQNVSIADIVKNSPKSDIHIQRTVLATP
jgi:hypothetical protein